ncbi:MAG TPA: EAL domain-containing protein [Gaiellaceae bacterium]|nr:EAL domain-containing protein [Gaiellaceae bacterium]
MLEAEVGAVVRRGAVVASVGFALGQVPAGQLAGIAAGERDTLEVPGLGTCVVASVPLEDDPSGRFILGRLDEPFDREDVSLLRGMSRVLTLTLHLLRVLAGERALRERSERQATENARLLESLQERQRLLEQLARLQRCISQRARIRDVLDAVVDGAQTLVGSDIAALRLVDPNDPAELLTAASNGLDPEILRTVRRVPAEAGVAGSAIAEAQAVLFEDYQSHPRRMADFVAAGVQTAFAVPVHEHGAVTGALVVARCTEGSGFTETERDMLLAYAEQASLALTAAKTADTVRHAFNDPLTGLPNRALLLDRMELTLGRGEREGKPVTVLFLDLDGFKLVNDSLGHLAGDRLLIDVARRLDSCVRRGDTVARLGGDEFAILLGEVGEHERAAGVAERVIDAFGEPFDLLGREVFVSASIGIAAGLDEPEDLLRNADVAMYRAKRSQPGTYATFERSMHEAVVQRLELEADLRRVIDRDELVLHYQPIVDLVQGSVVGVEALLRWDHPQRGLVAPLQFVPMAEETGLIVALGRWVLDEACRRAATWRAELGASAPWVSVNISGRQLVDSGLARDVRAALAAADLPPEALAVEITETVLVQDVKLAVERLEELRRLGVLVAIDDFGTGYSSLRYLRRFPADLLKVAKPFVDGLADPKDAALVQTILGLGRSLGLVAIAEGIETDDQHRRLAALGCPLGQGYLFARPVLPDALDDLLRSGRAPVA